MYHLSFYGSPERSKYPYSLCTAYPFGLFSILAEQRLQLLYKIIKTIKMVLEKATTVDFM